MIFTKKLLITLVSFFLTTFYMQSSFAGGHDK